MSKRVLKAITPLGDELQFHSLEGRESLSNLFEFRVSLLSKSHTISAPALLGKSFSIEIECMGGAKRYLDGHCTRFAFTGKHTTARYYSYEAIVRPTLWYATRGADMKVFQNKKVPDIVKEVLGKYPIDLDLSGLTASYRSWDYCVQYRESDFNFVSRLLEHEGIYYYFKHSAGSHTLCLIDAIGGHPSCPIASAIPFYAPDATYSDDAKDHFNGWLVSHAIDPGIYVTDEYDFKKPKADLSLNKNKTRPHANATYEIYDFPGGYTETGDGEHYAQMRMDALQSGHEVIEGNGHVRNAAVGHTFSLTNHKRGDQNRQYLVQAIDYAMADNDYESDGSGEYRFNVHVTAWPTTETYRPKRLTPKPHTTGPESAVIVGPKGEEIYTDKYGRVKVQFHWDRLGKSDQTSSCWIRVSHPWAGSNFGGIFTPRIGQEVLIDFINGDPDRPIVTHRLYNEDQMPPWQLPKHKTQSGFETRWSKGGAGKHKLRFEDKAGIEHIELSTTYGQTHLHMGYLMNQGSEAKRSYGFELRTNEWGAIRADKGLLITTYTQDYTQKVAHENPDGFGNLGAGLSHTAGMMQNAKAAMSGAKDLIGALRDGRAQQLTSLVPSLASAFSGGNVGAAVGAVTGALSPPGGGGGGGETTTSDDADPAMADAQDVLKKSQDINKPIVSIVSPEGQSIISPKPVVISSGASVSVHAKSHITMSTGGQLTQLVKSAMYTHVEAGGQSTVVTSGDTTHTTAAGSLNLVSKKNASITSTTEAAHVEALKDVLIKSTSEGVLITAPKKIKLQCGSTTIEMDGVAGTITILAANIIATGSKATHIYTDEEFLAKGKAGNLDFSADLVQNGQKILLNC